MNHNAKAVYNFYLGWFDGNPSTLHPLPPVEASVRYVEYMGGPDAILERAQVDFDAGEYRWVAQVLNHVVFADASSIAARQLLADTLTQLGYQTENGVWRNFYLTGAQELRNGVLDLGNISSVNPDTLAAMPVTMLLDYLAVRLNGPAAAGLHLRIGLVLSDPDERLLVELRRSVLHCFSGSDDQVADLMMTMSSATFKSIVIGSTDLDTEVTAGRASTAGDPSVLGELIGLLDTFRMWFPIVEP